MFRKPMKGITLLKNFLPKYVTRDVFSLSYKMYVRPHLVYGDVLSLSYKMYVRPHLVYGDITFPLV